MVRDAFEQMPMVMTALAGPDHRVAAVNAAFRAFTGRDDVIGMAYRDAFPEIGGQQLHELLDRVAQMVDEGTIRTTLTRELGPINAATLREAHELVESGRMTGKVVVSGW